ncbi:hypothetical protein CR513_29703, partial [Mucuna pruriens]
MKEEMKALEKNSTLEIVDRPKDKRVVGCTWIYNVKCKSDGTLEQYKARLVAKGYTQTYGIDYEETFALITKMNMIRKKKSTWRFPQDSILIMKRKRYANSKRNYMDLKSLPKAWFERFTQVMISLEYRQSQGDHTLYIKHSPYGIFTILLVYVDDMIVTSDDEIEKLTLKEKLATQFKMKDLGKLKYFLNIEVAYSKQESIYSISSKKQENWDTRSQGHLLSRTIGLGVIEKSQYQRLVGKLIYLSHTRPNIVHVVSLVNQFMHDPKERHLQNSLVFEGKFRKMTTIQKRRYIVNGTDVDSIGSIVDRRFISEYFVFLGGNLVTWRSKKQNVVIRSSAEAKFRPMAHDICEGLWMKIILDDLKVKYEGSIKLFCDNNSAINIAHNPVQHDRTKHIEI